jgi:hypothetical protein
MHVLESIQQFWDPNAVPQSMYSRSAFLKAVSQSISPQGLRYCFFRRELWRNFPLIVNPSTACPLSQAHAFKHRYTNCPSSAETSSVMVGLQSSACITDHSSSKPGAPSILSSSACSSKSGWKVLEGCHLNEMVNRYPMNSLPIGRPSACFNSQHPSPPC